MRLQGTFRPELIEAFQTRRPRVGEAVVLSHDTGNPHDPNAVKGVSREDGCLLGHAPRPLAPILRANLEKGRRITATIQDYSHFPGAPWKTIDLELRVHGPLDAAKRYDPRAHASGVYCIVNCHSMKMYLGEAKNINERVNRHFDDLRRGTHFKHDLQNDWDTFGEGYFYVYRVGDECLDEEKRKAREAHWIMYWGTYRPENGYNYGEGIAETWHRGARAHIEQTPDNEDENENENGGYDELEERFGKTLNDGHKINNDPPNDDILSDYTDEHDSYLPIHSSLENTSNIPTFDKLKILLHPLTPWGFLIWIFLISLLIAS